MEPWPLGKPFPVAMTDADLMSVMQYARATFYRKKKKGLFDRFKLTNPVGHAIWSGKKVDAYVSGEPEPHEFRTKAFGAGRRVAEWGRPR